MVDHIMPKFGGSFWTLPEKGGRSINWDGLAGEHPASGVYDAASAEIRLPLNITVASTSDPTFEDLVSKVDDDIRRKMKDRLRELDASAITVASFYRDSVTRDLPPYGIGSRRFTTSAEAEPKKNRNGGDCPVTQNELAGSW